VASTEETLAELDAIAPAARAWIKHATSDREGQRIMARAAIRAHEKGSDPLRAAKNAREDWLDTPADPSDLSGQFERANR
jgi:hypothetical protein